MFLELEKKVSYKRRSLVEEFADVGFVTDLDFNGEGGVLGIDGELVNSGRFCREIVRYHFGVVVGSHFGNKHHWIVGSDDNLVAFKFA